MEKITTIAIYVEDHKKLEDLCRKGESFRDKFKSILNGWIEFQKN